MAKHGKKMNLANVLCTAVFLVIVGVLAAANLVQGERPVVSEAENRALAAFPAYSGESLRDGSFFAGIDAFVSDTFVGREGLIKASRAISRWKSVYAYVEREDEFMIVAGGDGGAGTGEPGAAEQPEPEDAGTGEGGAETDGPEEDEIAEAAEPEPFTVAVPEVLGHTLIFDDMAVFATMYEAEVADTYVATVETLAAVLAESGVTLDLILAPTRYATLNNSKLNEMFVSERFIISNVYNKIDDSVNTVDVYDNILSHKDEYIYFNSDHHWSSLGAYYAYQTYAEAKGFTPLQVEDCSVQDNGDFIGSMYGMSNVEAVKSMTDRMLVYVPDFSNGYTFYAYDKESGSLQRWKSMYTTAKSYYAFLGGDHADAVIRTEGQTGQNILVIKDSYGNAFIPYLAEHFDNVYIMDPRYAKQSVSRYIQDKNITHALLINNQQVQDNKPFIENIKRIAK